MFGCSFYIGCAESPNGVVEQWRMHRMLRDVKVVLYERPIIHECFTSCKIRLLIRLWIITIENWFTNQRLCGHINMLVQIP